MVTIMKKRTKFHPVSSIANISKCKNPSQQPDDWKVIESNPNYLVSRYGDIWSKRHNCCLAGFVDKRDPTNRILIPLDCKNKYLHIVYATAWVPNPHHRQYPRPNDDHWQNFTPSNWYWSNIKGGSGYLKEDIIKIFNYVRDNITRLSAEKIVEALDISPMILVRIQQAIIHMYDLELTCNGETFVDGFVPMVYRYQCEIHISSEYEINPFGLVKNIDEDRITFGTPGDNGYINVIIYERNIPRKILRLHVAVALTFIPNPEHKPQVNHINSIRRDPCVYNLEWCTNSENIEHARLYGHIAYGERTHTNVLSSNQVEEICELLSEGNIPIGKIAKMYNVCNSTIKSIRDGVNWIHISSNPKYNIRYLNFSGGTPVEDTKRTAIIQARFEDFRKNGRTLTREERCRPI